MTIPTTLLGLAEYFQGEALSLQNELDATPTEIALRYVVTVSNLPIRISNGTVTTSRLNTATTFESIGNARRVAGDVRNGNDERGTVSTLMFAYVSAIGRLQLQARDLIIEAHYQGV